MREVIQRKGDIFIQRTGSIGDVHSQRTTLIMRIGYEIGRVRAERRGQPEIAQDCRCHFSQDPAKGGRRAYCGLRRRTARRQHLIQEQQVLQGSRVQALS
jgi:hypothetical protein